MADKAGSSPADTLKAQVDFLNKVWTDEAFRARLDRDPKAALEELGGQIPDNIEIKVVHDTDTVKYLHIPAPPTEGEITDADLQAAQGGTTAICVTVATVVTVMVTGTVSLGATSY